MNLQLFGECRKKMVVKGKFSVVWDFPIDVLLLGTFSPLSLYRLLGNLLSFRRSSTLLLFLFPQPPIKAIWEFSPVPDGFPNLEKKSDNSVLAGPYLALQLLRIPLCLTHYSKKLWNINKTPSFKILYFVYSMVYSWGQKILNVWPLFVEKGMYTFCNNFR